LVAYVNDKQSVYLPLEITKNYNRIFVPEILSRQMSQRE